LLLVLLVEALPNWKCGASRSLSIAAIELESYSVGEAAFRPILDVQQKLMV
jgi:hypothetical protein